ncbi:MULTISPECIES: diol dehydratase small subunit [unclassified Luteococcus]|uniref:diol dehydratase small subunit n=1 Tax=unclassified Luteococcus TaxID=2639923 RepID=UPI00313E16F7
MESEELVRKIMAEVMASLGNDQVTFAKAPAPAAASASSTSQGRVTAQQYPLGEKVPDRVKSNTGKVLSDFTLERVLSGELKADDFRISRDTLEMQAQVAESVHRETLARNMRRASELIAVPDDRLLEVYNALRPYRSTKAELLAIADELANQYHCPVNAAFIREAAEVYEQRGRLKQED